MPRLALPTPKNWLRIAAVVVAIPGCYLAYLLGTAFAPTRAPVAAAPAVRSIGGLTADAESLDIGEVWEDPAFVREVMLTNTGDRPVVVTNLSGGCECTQVEPRAFTVPPGGRQAVRVSIDLTHRLPFQFGAERRELALPLHLTVADRGVAAGAWTLTGLIASRLSLNGRTLEFASLCGHGGKSVTRAMRATAHVPLANLTASVPPDRAKVEVRPVSGKPDQFDIRVTPSSDMPLGIFRFSVPMTATLQDGRVVPCASFDVTGEMVSSVRVVPGPVLLGEHPIGSSVTGFVSVQLPEPGWVVERVESERTDTSIDPCEALDGHVAYRITQLVGSVGDHSARVQFVCRRPGGSWESVHVSVMWHGTRRTHEAKP